MRRALAIMLPLLLASTVALSAPEDEAAGKELPPVIQGKITKLSAKGNELAKRRKYSEAIATYWKAWDLLPEPKKDWDAALWLLAAIGDANFLNKDYDACRDNLSAAMHVPGAIGNPFIHLRLGECHYELGNIEKAADELARAYIPEGKAIFASEDAKYLTFVKSKLKPPPNGWPDGW